MYNFFTYEAEVTRQTYINNKSSYISTGETYNWYLKPLSIKDWIDESMFWKEFYFTTYVDSDIKESDKLVIDWETYSVKWVSKFKALQEIIYLKCLLHKW